jgi:hypothetical protein
MGNRAAAGWLALGIVCALAPGAAAQDPPPPIDLAARPAPPIVSSSHDKTDLKLLLDAFRFDARIFQADDPARLNNFSVPKWQATASAGRAVSGRVRVDVAAALTRGFERSPVLSQELGGTISQWIEHAFTGPGSYATTATGTIRVTVPLKTEGRVRASAIGELWLPLWSTGHASMDGSFLGPALKAGVRTTF